ncbi:MAG: 1,4-alpha-glucan branching protein GlgB [Acidimicrobiia bacterium]|nr:1,4-alpha-glucan branching protein GlgB [Acidimicrobiia bacterium]
MPFLGFSEGRHSRLHDHLGAHLHADGAYFAVWAPNARAVSVVGDFNGWNHESDPLTGPGIWTGTVPNVGEGNTYKYHIEPQAGMGFLKSDPFAFATELAPKTASVVWDLAYEWQDDEWMKSRGDINRHDKPISIYELHLGSWKRHPNGDSFSYREMGPALAEYAGTMGYTHVELMPVNEHPYYPSWGYQATGFFAPTSRYGTPQDLMFMIDYLHQHGIGVILDWVPAHFAEDDAALAGFDGTHLYEHPDPRKGAHPDWGTLIFNYERGEVRSFLLSSADFWLRHYHIDGLRVDGVASMLYLDYSRKSGEWAPNEFGGNENLAAVTFLQDMNASVYGEHPGIITIAEESTAWPGVSRPTSEGGLGFGFKWDMGWMHDTLHYLSNDPLYRGYHINELTFRMIYAYNENFVLALSHDEVVHGKGSLLSRMPGYRPDQFANLRLLYGYMFGLPGKKHLFMGCDLAQAGEWNHDGQVDWNALVDPHHSGVQAWVRALNHLYRDEPSLSEWDYDHRGFNWIDYQDSSASVVSFLRRSPSGRKLVFICNFTPVARDGYRIGVPDAGTWQVVLDSNDEPFGGTGPGPSAVGSDSMSMHGQAHSIELHLPPLSVLILGQV